MSGGAKTVVIHPPQEVESDFIDYPYFTDLGAWLLTRRLKKLGRFVHLLDAFALPGADVRTLRGGRTMFGAPYAALLERLGDADFDNAVIHFTPYMLRAPYLEGLHFLLGRLKELRPGAKLVGAELYTGGMHRVEPDEARLQAAYPQLDAFVTLEGEQTVPELLDGREFDRFLYRGEAPGKEMLGETALFDAELLDLEAYRAFLKTVAPLHKVRQYGVDENTLAVYFSRGCPFSCSFCTNPYQDYRAIPLDRCKALMERAATEGFLRLFVLDDSANARRDFPALLEGAAEAGLKLVFPNGLRADLLSEDIVKLLATVADELTVSAESASPRVQKDIVGKNVSAAHVERVAKWCLDARLPLLVHWMVGLPGETRTELLETLDAARRLLDDYGARPLVQYATPVAGTTLAAAATAATADAETRAELTAGQRMQHEPTFLPGETTAGELAAAVDLLRRRGDQSATAKVIINITYRCNNHCVFCAVGNRIQEDLPFDYVSGVLKRYIKAGVRQLDIDGGEPTLHPELIDIIRYAVSLGYNPISITTNARRLSYPGFARKLLSSGINNLLVSIHGHTAEIHEKNTLATGGFEETMAGLHNAISLNPGDVDVGVNTTLSVHNFLHLDELTRTLHELGVQRLNIQFLTPFGRAAAEVVPDPEDAAEVVRGVISRWSDRITFQVINLPYCYLEGLEQFVAPDLGKLSRNMVFVTKEEVNLYKYLADTRVLDEGCSSCLYRVACDGKYDFGTTGELE